MFRYRPLGTGPTRITVSTIDPSSYVHGSTVVRYRTSRTGLNR
ncbi:MAG: hypothetical protein QOI68_2030 [Pseudonocardiales bacterium]|jgi:hypothetical protein|nr:hypothetical protein [Pseudonocardiales bacterium]MDT7644983.1 hypothetical protein [Pseudonocardiales bacterium]MDT7693477.1 hypothetical protein [Pseudonocardiales bacterium]